MRLLNVSSVRVTHNNVEYIAVSGLVDDAELPEIELKIYVLSGLELVHHGIEPASAETQIEWWKEALKHEENFAAWEKEENRSI